MNKDQKERRERKMMLRPWNDPDARPCPAGCSGAAEGLERERREPGEIQSEK